MSKSDPAEGTVRDIRRKTRKQYTAEEKIRIVVSGLRGGGEASPPCAAARASPRVCITAGRKSFWKRVRSGSPATPGAKRPRARLKACARRCATLKELVAELSLENRLLKKKHDRAWGRRGMRYPASEKLEIIRLVEQSHLGVGSTLEQAGAFRRPPFIAGTIAFWPLATPVLRIATAAQAGCGTGSRMMSGGRSSILPWRRRNCRPGNWPSGLRTPGATLSRKPRFTGFSRPTT